MSRSYSVALFLAAAAAATPALAQEQAPGAYGVVRAGVAVDGDLKFKDGDAAAPANVRKDEDLKPGFTGELGVGYKTGVVRVEGVVGFARANLDAKRTGGSRGRASALNLGLSAYVDIPTGSPVTPYLGGGLGASRVDGRFSRVGGEPASGSRFSGKDWGFQWHLDAGVAVQAAEKTVVEVGARYARTDALEFKGLSGPIGPGAVADGFKPRFASVSILAGIRQAF